MAWLSYYMESVWLVQGKKLGHTVPTEYVVTDLTNCTNYDRRLMSGSACRKNPSVNRDTGTTKLGVKYKQSDVAVEEMSYCYLPLGAC